MHPNESSDEDVYYAFYIAFGNTRPQVLNSEELKIILNILNARKKIDIYKKCEFLLMN